MIRKPITLPEIMIEMTTEEGIETEEIEVVTEIVATIVTEIETAFVTIAVVAIEDVTEIVTEIVIMIVTVTVDVIKTEIETGTGIGVGTGIEMIANLFCEFLLPSILILRLEFMQISNLCTALSLILN